MKLQTVVQHDPRRAHLLPHLLARLPNGTLVVSDPAPGDPIRSPWRCYQACLQALEPDVTHLLIVQDDTLPCLDLEETLGRVIAAQPDRMVALFVPGLGINRKRVLDACAADKRYVQLDPSHFVPTVALVWPAELVGSMLEYAEMADFGPHRTADDGNLAEWSEWARIRVIATVPSLVEHPDVSESLIGKRAMGGRNPARIATCFLGETESGLQLDW